MQTATLIISQPDCAPRKLEADGSPVSVGRDVNNTVCLQGDSNVSRHHAIIESRSDGWWVCDLESRNGTSVNGEPVESERKLSGGDVICFGGASTIEIHPREAGAGEKGGSAVRKGGRKPWLTTSAAVVGGLAVTLVALTLLGYAFNGRTGVKQAAQKNGSPQVTTESGQAKPVETTELPPETPDLQTQVAAVTQSDLPPPPPPTDDEQVGELARTLALQISQRNIYTFDPAFVGLIRGYIAEYRADPRYFERARRYSDEIDTEFTNQNVPPLLGYIMAMSLSKFDEQGGGVWRLPTAVARELAPKDAAPDVPAAAGGTKLAARHMKGLLSQFEVHGFMYVAACYGMTPEEYGRVRIKLEEKDPGGQTRYDFWKMKNAGVVRDEQVKNAARFFAAGIVSENPERYGLKTKPLSTLID